MIDKHDIDLAIVSSGPTPGPWTVTDSGKIVPHNSDCEELDYIADIQLAPQGNRNIPVICAASLSYYALKRLVKDPKFKGLSADVQEMVQEALTAAE